jgi:hypothetical protein
MEANSELHAPANLTPGPACGSHRTEEYVDSRADVEVLDKK